MVDNSRCWILREFPSRPAEESRWAGHVLLFAHLPQTLSNSRLDQLARHQIRGAQVSRGRGELMFQFYEWDPEENMNILFDKSPINLWWFWPMESVVPDETSDPELPCRGPVGRGHVEKMYSADHDGELRHEAAVLLLAKGVQSLVWGLTVLLYAASIAFVTLSLVAVVVFLRWDGSLEGLRSSC